jgi:Uma2 family endonuclease
MLAHRERRLFTPAEYLALEENSDTKSEYYQGEIFAMSGGSVEHGQLSRNLIRLLGNALQGGSCQPFGSDVRLRLTQHDLFTYPDLYVVCGPLVRMPGRSDTLLDATMIVEILSPKTEIYDRGEKFVFYQSLPSFCEYLLVSQTEKEVERYFRGARGGWSCVKFRAGQTLSLKSIDCSLAIDEIYQGIALLDTHQGV